MRSQPTQSRSESNGVAKGCKPIFFINMARGEVHLVRGRDEETVAGLCFVPIHQTIFGLWVRRGGLALNPLRPPRRPELPPPRRTKSTCVGVGDIFLSARGLPSLATRSRPLHAWWVSILHSVIGCQGVAAIAAGWLVDGYPIWCKGKSETGGERAEVIGRAMLKRGARKLGSGQVRRYLASMYLWGRPRPACQKGQSATELLAETISPLPPTHTNLHRVRGPTGRQAARLLVSRPASFPIGVFATRLHLNAPTFGGLQKNNNKNRLALTLVIYVYHHLLKTFSEPLVRLRSRFEFFKADITFFHFTAALQNKMDTQTFRADAAISPGPRSECGQKPPEDLETNFVGDQLEFARLDSSTYAITIVGTRVLKYADGKPDNPSGPD
ncbi:hypothetical protein MCOR07_006422 [Pyricularia oryzae]|uniref:Uncharacterized protein n=2 Tax=Pyricularia TaxID=48558 RepID=A0ABQ8NV93_PYRGI|nr:hypothetical protein MCOR19_000883 [Pyricularia oryzae]KAI6302623.1 hypothetical protein MCOR33_002048 [Pyricularia grisea]KAI6344434.1 hypothetical protein MCOR28_004185 [Pyricularia oryzae]KAI6411130.1 hypothetical protein MCOR23_000002 [Pyricularia oryzae]KAI6474689.1 hypothetical protein MCOR17_001938 [Pyricularia oryzae]